jgi:hypothetical protein
MIKYLQLPFHFDVKKIQQEFYPVGFSDHYADNANQLANEMETTLVFPEPVSGNDHQGK